MQFRVVCLEYNLLCVLIGVGDLLDDVDRHGCHDFFGVTHFKREVFRVVNISSNQLTTKVTYNSYYAKLYFTIVQKAMHLNNNGLFKG